MMDNYDPWTRPITTRSPIAGPGARPEAPAVRRIPTRGAIRGGGATGRTTARQTGAAGRLKMASVISGLRAAQLGSQPGETERSRPSRLPLTVVIHGYGGEPARLFLDALAVCLRPSDALWLIPADGSPMESGRPARGVLLDLNREADQFIYGNMNADILYYPDFELPDELRPERWAGRVRLLVSPEHERSVGQATRGVGAPPEWYIWREEGGDFAAPSGRRTF